MRYIYDLYEENYKTSLGEIQDLCKYRRTCSWIGRLNNINMPSFQKFRCNLPVKESESEIAQSCPTLCNPMDCSLPGSACSAGDLGSIPGLESSRGEGNGNSSTLAWKIPWTEEHGRPLQSMGSQRVGHDRATSLTHTFQGNK